MSDTADGWYDALWEYATEEPARDYGELGRWLPMRTLDGPIPDRRVVVADTSAYLWIAEATDGDGSYLIANDTEDVTPPALPGVPATMLGYYAFDQESEGFRFFPSRYSPAE